MLHQNMEITYIRQSSDIMLKRMTILLLFYRLMIYGCYYGLEVRLIFAHLLTANASDSALPLTVCI